MKSCISIKISSDALWASYVNRYIRTVCDISSIFFLESVFKTWALLLFISCLVMLDRSWYVAFNLTTTCHEKNHRDVLLISCPKNSLATGPVQLPQLLLLLLLMLLFKWRSVNLITFKHTHGYLYSLGKTMGYLSRRWPIMYVGYRWQYPTISVSRSICVSLNSNNAQELKT